MKVTVDVPATELAGFRSGLEEMFEGVRPQVQAAMGQRFYEVVMGNFGVAGVDRPHSWAPLSPAYAARVGREIATLHVTGALKSAVMVGGSYGDSVTVEVNDSSVPYATAHQYGKGRMPARPYFPVDGDGNVMPYTVSQVVEAAEKALEAAL